MLTALSSIASQQSASTAEKIKGVKQFFDYCASQEDEITNFRKSNMELLGHIDAGYLNYLKSQRRAGGNFYMSNSSPIPPNNGAVITISQIIKAVMSSAAEAELGALFIYTREAVYMRQILEYMGHKQGQTLIQTDNSIAEGFIKRKIEPKHTKRMDMRFHWL